MSNELESYRFVEGCDQRFATLYGVIEKQIMPQRRYLLLADLVGHPDHQVVTSRARGHRDYLRSILLAEGQPVGSAQLLGETEHNLRALLHCATYTVASYWSPLDKRRRSIIRWQEQGAYPERRRLSAAILFYALTNLGRRFVPPQTSVIQYLSEVATLKRGFQIAFAGKKPAPDVLSIGADAKALWRHAGLDGCIDDIAVDQADFDLDDTLYRLIVGSDLPAPSLVQKVVGRAFDGIDRAVAAAEPRLAQYLDRVAATMNRTFHNHERGPIEQHAALMFVLTSMLWRIAIGGRETRFMYAFPTAVGDTCCVLTIGTRRMLSQTDRLHISHLAQTAFTQPLLQDYKTREHRGVESRNNNVFRRLLGHNLPKLLIKPGLNELHRMQLLLSRGGERQDDDLERAVARLRMLFRHYEGFLGAVMSSDTLADDFQRKPELFPLDRDFWPHLRVAFGYARDHLPKAAMRPHVQLEFDPPRGLYMIGHPEFAREIVFNVLTNAVTKLPPDTVMNDTDRGLVTMDVEVGHQYVPGACELVIRVKDRGVGFMPDKLAEHRRIKKKFEDSDPSEFWTEVSNEVEEALAHRSKEGNLGIGLIFCLAYLRSLEWAPVLGKRGDIQIRSLPGVGTEVTLRLPGVAAGMTSGGAENAE